MSKRVKLFHICEQEFTTMYRIEFKQPKEWVFVCEKCLLDVKPNNPHYKYGGTWKK